jgi:hypothetical protein
MNRRKGAILLAALSCAAVWLSGCGESKPTESRNNDMDAVEDASIEAAVCLGSSCSTANDCGQVGPCIAAVSCEAGCCVVEYEKPGKKCEEPCQVGGTCDGLGTCEGLQPVECPEVDGNPCTRGECDPKSGKCGELEVPLADGVPPFKSRCWEGIVCQDGQPDTSAAVPTELELQCEGQAAEIDPFGCVDQIQCVDSQEDCVVLLKDSGVPCWLSGGGGTGQACKGRSCNAQGDCIPDTSLDEYCDSSSFPQDCGPECQACTELSCHWIPDPANPEGATKKVKYCRADALVTQACEDGNECTSGDVCVLDLSMDGPLGKETVGLCTAGEGTTKEECLAELLKPGLSCILAGMGCDKENGCFLDQQKADEWCYPPASVCFDKGKTFCTHLDLGDGLWDPQTGCHLKLVDETTCDDGNPCTDDECDGTQGCSNTPNKAACDDGSLCTVGDVCVEGYCDPGPLALECGDKDPCTLDSCDPLAGCQHKPQDVGPCDDGDSCTSGESCMGGLCTGGTVKGCDDKNPCTKDWCDAVLDCQHEPQEGFCDDFDPCTQNDSCSGGMCAGLFKPDCCGNAVCEAGEACQCVEDCLGAGCQTDPCLQGESCQGNGACGGGQPKPTCCGDGTCAEAEKCGCVDDCKGFACNDGNAQTYDDACSAGGKCEGKTPNCTDKLKNGGETDVDCGGPSCPKCGNGQDCIEDKDCQSGLCENGKCVSPVSCGVVGKGSSGALGSVVLSGSVTINTDSGQITAGGNTVVTGAEAGVELLAQNGQANGFAAPKLRVYHFADLEVASGAVVTVTGKNGLALLTSGTLTVAGVVDLGGGDGTSGGTNTPGTAGGGGSGGWTGGQWVSGPGCAAGNGMATGPGAGQEGSCGGGGGEGADGASGGGAGGGGGGCGGAGGAGGSHATAGVGGLGGASATAGSAGAAPGSPGLGGSGCGGPGPGSSSGNPYGDQALGVLFGGTGGSGGGFGGFAGFGGWGVGTGGTGYGGVAGYSGGPGGGGGGGGALLVCSGGTLEVKAGAELDVSGGLGGVAGGSGISENGKQAQFGTGPIGGGGGGGRSGGGGGGGGGSGGSLYIEASAVQVFGSLKAGGGPGGAGGWSGGGGFGGSGKNGGGSGGKGGDGGKGGAGGKGGDGYIRVKGGTVILQGQVTGKLTQG